MSVLSLFCFGEDFDIALFLLLFAVCTDVIRRKYMPVNFIWQTVSKPTSRGTTYASLIILSYWLFSSLNQKLKEIYTHIWWR